MAASGQRLIPLNGLNLDVAPQYLKDTQARYIKNLYYQLSDLGEAGTPQGANTGVLKPLPSNEIYCPIDLPEGNNHVIGVYPSRETNELYVFAHNSLNNHVIFRVNGLTQTGEIIKVDSCFDFKLQPQYFIGEGQVYLEVIYLTEPITGEQIIKKDLYWTLGINYQGYLRVDDSIDTNGFDETKFSYFKGNYDKCTLVRMGLPTPNDCIKIESVPFNPLTDTGKNNNLKNTTWQFRILNVDVFGRPSEHGMISDLYFVNSNECLGASDMLSRCVNLTFPAGNPIIDKIQIEYRNCNDEQWYLDSVLELYQGSNLGAWWLRVRNPDIVYNYERNEVTYTFCKDKLCDPIDTNETNRTAPGLSRTSQSVAKIGKEIALSNNKDGFPPLAKSELDKISIEIVNPVQSNIGNTVNITVWVRIFNPNLGSYQKIWLKDGKYAFGGITRVNNGYRGIDNIISDYQQYFAVEGQKGYVGYLAGTSNYAVSTQYSLDANNNFVKDIDFIADQSQSWFQKFEFFGVPKSNYIFRIAGHLADSNVVDIRTKSTYIGGVYNFANFNIITPKSINKELVINACNGDYDTLTSGEMLLAFDLTRPVYETRIDTHLGKELFSNTTVTDGYVYEGANSITGTYEKTVELLQLQVVSPGNSNKNSVITDHNGFFWACSISNHLEVTMVGYCRCNKQALIKGNVGSGNRRYADDMVIGLTNQPFFFTYCPDYDVYPCSRILIKGKVQSCVDGTPVPNLSVVLSRGGIGVTDASGNFTIIAHDDATSNVRNDKLYVMGGSCGFTGCDGACIEVKNVSIIPCNACLERSVDTGIFEVLFTTNKGLLSGGRYGASINGYDWIGRHGFAQTTDKLYFNIPSLNETKTFGFATVNLIIPPSVTFPSWMEYLTVGVTVELNYGGNLIEWIADKVQFVDNSGKENLSAPTQIKIYYSSLNEYNTKNNFNTTTGWQITPTSSTSPRTADIVQFIRNGDGTWFDNPITALVKYDQAGQYFLINYTSALKDLKDNALIRLANPQDCANKDAFFELCGKYKISNGKILQNRIALNAFDTYYQYRQIPVPVTSGTGDDEVTIIELRQFGFPFEHPSVSDFFGLKCWNIGRFNVRNPYEAELIHLNQIALSGSLSVNAQLNYLNYFDNKNKIDFNVNSTGGIVYIRVKTGLVLIVCQYKNFIVGYADNIARLNADNIVQVPSGEGTFGRPERSYSSNFGCQIFDKNTIREIETEGQAFCQWLDRNNVAILQNDFQNTIDVSRYNAGNSTVVSWLLPKIKYQQQFNSGNVGVRYFHSSINPQNFGWLLSEFTIGSNEYVNTERGVDVSKHETIEFDILSKVWRQFISPTPEYMAYLKGSNDGIVFFYFKRGVPYSNTGISYNTFFSVSCERVYRLVFNTDGFKKKKMQSIEVYCPSDKYWSDVVLTETQQSRLLKAVWKKSSYFYSAAFMCDLNTAVDSNVSEETGVNKIMDGDNLVSSFVDVRLIGSANGEYNELYGVVIFAQGEEQSGADK